MFERFTCWDVADATKILRPLALEGNEAVFRATHSQISGLIVTGTDAHEVSDATEKGLLAALSSSDRHHAMCVVEGEAGSGKSHLIRWLKVNWPNGRDVTVLIERADGTLDGTLRQLNDKLATESGMNLDSIVPRHKLTDQGQRASLLLQLGNLCRSGTLSEPLGDEDWCEKHGLADMLQSEVVRTLWKAPERVLEVLTNGSDRNSKVARFTARDVLELRQPMAGLRGINVGPGAIRLAYLLRQEAQAIDSALASCPPGVDDPDISVVAPNTSRFLTALNSRLSLAIQSAMGISGAALQKMFRDLRRALMKKGKRLVLLLEDLTGAQGIDQELFYVLQERSTTQEQFCDLVSVVGITPAYFRQFIAPQANVVQRITHHVRFGRVEGSFQAVSALENHAEQVAFAARYLRAIRAGMDEIERAAQDHMDVINRCEECKHHDECHEVFGQVEGVGLYPLTEKAVVRMFSSLRDPKGMMFLQTPRALIQGVLAPSISAEAAIRAGSFPVPTVETEWHPISKREVHGLAHELVDMAPDEFRERLRTTVAWWGEAGFPIKGDLPGEWAGVPEGVFIAWGLPRPVSSFPASSPFPNVPSPSESDASSPPPKPTNPVVAEPEAPGQPIRPAVAKGAVSTTTKRAQPKAKIDEQLERLRQWTRTKKIEDDGFWRDRANAFIKNINWKDEDIPHWFVREALGEVRLQGSGKTDQRNVVIPCTLLAARGLEWSARLESGNLSRGEYDFAIQAMAVFAQHLRKIVRDWVFSRIPEVQPGTSWQFDATVVQVLLTRAWLRGETFPEAPLVEQWKVILSDDSPGGAGKRPGAVGWNKSAEQLAADSTLHRRLRSLVGCSEVVADVVFAAPAIRILAEKGQFVPFPTNPPEQPVKTKWLSSLVESALIAERALTDLPSKEVSRLRERSTQIIDTTGATGFAMYLKRAEIAFDKVRQDLPNCAASDLSAWFKLYEAKQALLKPGPDSEHDRLQAFLDARALASVSDDAPVPVLLTHAIQAPAEPLEYTYALVKDTSALIDTLVDYLSDYATSISNVQEAATVVEFGERIVKGAVQLKNIIQGNVKSKEAQS
jgi:hypothetical protein